MVIDRIEYINSAECLLLRNVGVEIERGTRGTKLILPDHSFIHYIIRREQDTVEECIHVEYVLIILRFVENGLVTRVQADILDSRNKSTMRGWDHRKKRGVYVW